MMLSVTITPTNTLRPKNNPVDELRAMIPEDKLMLKKFKKVYNQIEKRSKRKNRKTVISNLRYFSKEKDEDYYKPCEMQTVLNNTGVEYMSIDDLSIVQGGLDKKEHYDSFFLKNHFNHLNLFFFNWYFSSAGSSHSKSKEPVTVHV